MLYHILTGRHCRWYAESTIVTEDFENGEGADEVDCEEEHETGEVFDEEEAEVDEEMDPLDPSDEADADASSNVNGYAGDEAPQVDALPLKAAPIPRFGRGAGLGPVDVNTEACTPQKAFQQAINASYWLGYWTAIHTSQASLLPLPTVLHIN